MPFVVSLSNHERPFDKLRANGLDCSFVAMTKERALSLPPPQGEGRRLLFRRMRSWPGEGG